MRVKISILCLALCVISTSYSQKINIDQQFSEWHKSDTVFTPKLFKFMLMIPQQKDTLAHEITINDDISEINFAPEKPVHPEDVMGQVVQNFIVKGGKRSNLHIVSDHQSVNNTFKNFMMKVEEKHHSKMPFKLIHRHRQIANLKTRSLYDCFNLRNKGLGVSLKKDAEETTLKVGDWSLTLNKDKFAPYEHYLKDICTLVEYSKLQQNDHHKNMMVYHLQSYNSLPNHDSKQKLYNVLIKAISALKTNLERSYGKSKTKLLISKFVEKADSDKPSNYRRNNNRVLAEIENPQSGEHILAADDTTGTDFATSLKYTFSIVLIFIYAYICIYIYRIEVFKDSLVYSKFISVRKQR